MMKPSMMMESSFCSEPTFCSEPFCQEGPVVCHGDCCTTFWQKPLVQDVCDDYCNYYSWRNARGYLLAIGGGAILANTSLDSHFQDWYQDDVRSTETDNFACFWRGMGIGDYVAPAFIGLAIAGKVFERQYGCPIAGVVGEHGYRTTRAYLVGAPPLVFSQFLLGGSRPGENPHGSTWRPFSDNNGVSGHSFVGAVPFITAAQMSENGLVKACFYTLSTFPAWSRVNDDAHYLSQVCLGWYMAYMACRSVNETEHMDRCFEIVPLCQPDCAGIIAIWKR